MSKSSEEQISGCFPYAFKIFDFFPKEEIAISEGDYQSQGEILTLAQYIFFNKNLNCFVIIKKGEIVRTKFGSNHILEF